MESATLSTDDWHRVINALVVLWETQLSHDKDTHASERTNELIVSIERQIYRS